MMAKRVIWMALLAVALSGIAIAAEFTPAVTMEMLDLPQCQAYAEGRALGAAPHAVLPWMLGIAEKPADGPGSWTTGPLSVRTRHFRVAFKQPVALGSIITTYSGGRSLDTLFQMPSGTRVSYLIADAVAPGEVTKDEQWVVLSPGLVKALPVGVKTRALRFTEYKTINKDEMSPSVFPAAYLFQERYYNPLVVGVEKELVKGNASNAWLACWDYPQLPALAGVFIAQHRAPSAGVEVLKATAEEHPLITNNDQWRKLPATVGNGGALLYKFDPPVPTRAVRLSPTAGGRDFSYTMGKAVPLVNLGTAPAPPTSALPPAPVQLQYTMPMDGFIAINVTEKKTGKAVRRLVAEVPRLAGGIQEEWDLKDDAGQYVAPGEYEWRAIARPPLKLTYEMTVNNGGQPAWWAPSPGKGGGGWLADHTPPHAVCALNDYLFIGSGCAESGHAMVATDLEGNKLWGEHNMFGGFLGVRWWASDGDRYVYMVNGAGIMRMDTKDNLKAQPINLDITYTREVPGPGSGWGEHISGATARNGKLYLAYNAPPVSWIQSTFTAGDLDLMKSMPIVRRVRPGRDAYREGEFDEVQQFHSTFLDGNAASWRGNSWGDAPKNGPLAGTLTVTFKQPVPIGTVLVHDTNVKVYALKPGMKLPGAAEDLDPDAGVDIDVFGGDPVSEDEWIPLTTTGKAGQAALALTAKGLTTTALRFKTDRIKYALVMSHRFVDVAPAATRIFTDGHTTAQGGWMVTRDSNTRPISPYDPACAALVWKEPTSLRGVTMVGMVEAKTAVDYWVGPLDGDPQAALTDDTKWKQMSIVEAEMHGPYPQTPAARSVDFGANITTRAVRIRAIAPKGDTSYMGNRGVPVSGEHKAGFESIIAYSHLGGETDLPLELNQRISEFQLPADPAKEKAKLLRHLPYAKPGVITFAPDGSLYAQSGKRIVRMPLDEGKEEEIIPAGKVDVPMDMVCDADGLLYVVDGGPKVVKVFDTKTGALVRTIGTAGGTKLGAWDPNRFINPYGVTVDKNGRVWVADYDTQPKRISRWNRDGKIEKWFLGPTAYGGGGYLDMQDRTVLNYNGMKFVMDWDKRTWKLDSILFRPGLSVPGAMPDRAMVYKGKRYLVGDPSRDNGVASICVERNGVAVPLVMAGNLAGWGAINQYPELMKAYGQLNRGDYSFLWQDANNDALPQPGEVKVSQKYKLAPTYWPTKIGEDFTLNFRGERLRPTGAKPDGAPIYSLDAVETLPGLDMAWTTADGRTFVLGNKLYAADGKTVLWEYPDNYIGVHGSHRIGYDRPPGTLVGEHHAVGHFEVNGEELFVTNGNHGDWFAFTRDGLLAACIFGGPLNYGKRWWTMPEWEPGKTDLSELNVGEEHFMGHIGKANDGKVYAVAGHNHNSIVRVDGLEAMKRLTGSVAVTKADIEKTVAWDQQRAVLARLRQEPKLLQVPFLDQAPEVNGVLEDWPESLFLTIHERYNIEKNKWEPDMVGTFAYDAEHLYVAARVADESPMKNSAKNLNYLYKFGDAFDVTLGTDPKADPKRQTPAQGDLRLLLSRVDGKPVVMLYRYQVPEVADDKRVHIASPVTETVVDLVKEIAGAQVAIQTTKDGDWIMEAAIPWTEIGVKAPPIGSKLRGDVGVLVGDQNGIRTVARYYWAGKSQTVVSDLAFEARIYPALWGDLTVIETGDNMHFGPAEIDPFF